MNHESHTRDPLGVNPTAAITRKHFEKNFAGQETREAIKLVNDSI
jgi:hypothetical protein